MEAAVQQRPKRAINRKTFKFAHKIIYELELVLCKRPVLARSFTISFECVHWSIGKKKQMFPLGIFELPSALLHYPPGSGPVRLHRRSQEGKCRTAHAIPLMTDRPRMGLGNRIAGKCNKRRAKEGLSRSICISPGVEFF
jgi:hypothetical protein